MNNDIFDLNGTMLVFGLGLASILWIFIMSFFRKKRDEREAQALSKAVFLTVNNMGVIGIMYGIIAFGNRNFLIPTWHVFMLIAVGLIMVPVVYRIYLVKNNLEPEFISRMTKERKVNFYRKITYFINFGVLICIVMLEFTNGFQLILNVIALIMFFYISDLTEINTPNKKIFNEAKTNNINLILMIIGVAIAFYSLSKGMYSLFMN